MKRLLTAAVGVPLALWALFRLPAAGFFAVALVLFSMAALEYSRLLSHWAPDAPIWLVVGLVPLAAVALTPWIPFPQSSVQGAGVVIVLTLGVALTVVATRTPVEQGAVALGAIAFGSLYLGLPVAAVSDLQQRSPWLLFLLLAIVWLGDSAAYYFGTRFGRHRLAPVLSPNKSWEGAAAAVTAGVASALAWSVWREGAVDWPLIVLAVVASVAGQVGDLVESMIKRGAGVKDSGDLLPGHGGFLDRLDALIFAAPVWWLALDLSGKLPLAGE